MSNGRNRSQNIVTASSEEDGSGRANNVNESFTIKEIRALLEMLQKHEVTEFKLERGEEKIWLKRGEQSAANMPQQLPPAGYSYAQPMGVPSSRAYADETTTSGNKLYPTGSESQSGIAEPVPVRLAANIKEVISPMVGTFYRRPAVDAPPYVEVGDVVKKGSVLCIVEAMKLMNEIESEIAGKIVEICLEDGQMVEYGEVIFRIETL